MKKDAEVMLYMRERHKGTSQQVPAARAGMSERTARRYERAGKLPSQLKQRRTWRTRQNPFEDDWPWVVQQLQRDPAGPRSDLVCAAVRPAPWKISSDAGAHAPTPDRCLESERRARKGGLLRAGAYAWGACPVRFYAYGGSQHHDRWGSISALALPLRAHLLECGSDQCVLCRNV